MLHWQNLCVWKISCSADGPTLSLGPFQPLQWSYWVMSYWQKLPLYSQLSSTPNTLSPTCNDLCRFSLIFPDLLQISTNFWRREESSSLRRGQAHTSQPQGDMEEGNRPGQSIPATNRKNPYLTTRSWDWQFPCTSQEGGLLSDPFDITMM